MLQNLVCAAVAILAVWGSAGMVTALLLRLIRPKKSEPCVLLLRVSDGDETAAERVSYHLSRLSLTGELRHTVIAVVCQPADCGTARALKAAFAKEPRVTVCGPLDFQTRFLS